MEISSRKSFKSLEIATPTTETPRRREASQMITTATDQFKIDTYISDKISFNERDLIALGQSSKIYRAFFQGAVVAVKVALEDVDSRSALAKEISVLQSIRKHPNIIQVVDVVCSPQALVLPLALCNSLDFVQAFSPPKEIVVEIVVQMLTAIEYLHSNGFIHGDIKPQNILIMGREPTVKAVLADFGSSLTIAQVNDNDDLSTGTTAYTPPEAFIQAPVERESLCARDVYSAALACYQLVTQRPPFKSMGSPTRLILSIRQGFIECGDNGIPGDLVSSDREFYQDVYQFIALCTRKNPLDRPAKPLDKFRCLLKMK